MWPLQVISSHSFQAQCDGRGAQYGQRAREEHRADIGHGGDESQRRARQRERDVQKRGVRAHREASAVGRRAAHRLDAKTRVHERVAEAGKASADQPDRGRRREPEQRLAGRLHQQESESHPRAAAPVREMAEEHTREDESDRERGECRPHRPAARRESNATNAVIAPKPALVSAKPTPGSQTAATTLVSEGRTRAVGATRRSDATSSGAASGTIVVASAIAVKPKLPYKVVPAGAPSAKAAY